MVWPAATTVDTVMAPALPTGVTTTLRVRLVPPTPLESKGQTLTAPDTAPQP